VLIVNFVNGADVWMIQGGRSFGFALEAAQGLWACGYVVWQEFEGYEAIQLNVFCLVHRASRRCGNGRCFGRSLGSNLRTRSRATSRFTETCSFVGVGQPPVSRKLAHSDVVAAGYRHRGNFGGLRRLPFGKGFRRTTSYLADSFHFIHKSAKYRLIFV
jgi:hypothetical protein